LTLRQAKFLPSFFSEALRFSWLLPPHASSVPPALSRSPPRPSGSACPVPAVVAVEFVVAFVAAETVGAAAKTTTGREGQR
jgi:hypothetical protein